jgi:uncharacterized membrane protein
MNYFRNLFDIFTTVVVIIITIIYKAFYHLPTEKHKAHRGQIPKY